jgi:predicted amino acid dehydrogenase
VAFVGLGSIGRSSLELLLAQGGSSKSLVLCDVASRRHHLSALARDIAASGYCGRVTIACSDPSLPEEVYDTDLIVAAISGSSRSIVVDRLRPGTIVVDDSFPHCFDTSAARRRMARQGDVLMIGGGLLTCEPLERTPVNGVVTDAQLAHLTSLRPPNTIASCQLESLVQASRPDLPVVHGVVDHALARAYWDALTAAGVTAAPLHLLEQVVTPEYLGAFSPLGR